MKKELKGMDRLWAPWRLKYIRANKQKMGCIFCATTKLKKTNYLVFKTKYCIVMLNAFPYNNGHLMIAPIRHTADIASLSDSEILDLFKCLKEAKRRLDKVLKPQGYNLGINLSRAAGAGITGHLHLHIVPRWNGDTNFMPVIHSTKVVSQSLAELCKILKNVRTKRN